ncbi:hypothetical protein NK214_01720 [Chromobacterium sp. S0633]|nr:hypothetical protein [Chromobacterium sp. S0633]
MMKPGPPGSLARDGFPTAADIRQSTEKPRRQPLLRRIKRSWKRSALKNIKHSLFSQISLTQFGQKNRGFMEK